MTKPGPSAARGQPRRSERDRRAIEDGFPFAELSEVAELESWRKEIHRPVYHLHKWWAQRLGSVFRGALIGALSPAGSSVMERFWQPVSFPAKVVFDPFMGSGTTIGEAHKLGCTAIGRDINPVAVRTVRTALSAVSERDVCELFDRLEARVGETLRGLYRGLDSRNREADVLYFFWVKQAVCPQCTASVRLFSTHTFAAHAYAARNPRVHVVCPSCLEIFPGLVTDVRVTCPACASTFHPRGGAARRQTATCSACRHEFAIAQACRARGAAPAHEMYAKLVLTADGEKEYLRITDDDRSRFEAAARRLAAEDLPLPKVEICDGYNTRQIINHGYRYWSDLFNQRQSLALATLALGIRELPDGGAKDALATLFSGTLEFNNMFASYKGEGTGAVRHMFSHHVLRPERMPIEANVWGTPKSSGSFSTLFESRLRCALRYKARPFELAVHHDGRAKRSRKVLGLSPPMGAAVQELEPAEHPSPGGLYVSCGDSADTGLPEASVDLVLTDPPFFDNVHYSELADFFFVWQELYFGARSPGGSSTTRNVGEVQDADAARFATKLQAVLEESRRVLKDDGLLVFSYHHSRDAGWSSVWDAVVGAGFGFVQAQPVKSEMSVAAPKTQAKEPIDLDVLLVCRKRSKDRRKRASEIALLARASADASGQVQRFNQMGRRLSRGDVRVVVMSQLLVAASPGRDVGAVSELLAHARPAVEALIERLFGEQARLLRPSAPGAGGRRRG